MWWMFWWGGSDWTTIILTQDEIQTQCVHVWRDILEDETSITQNCVRCKLERKMNKII